MSSQAPLDPAHLTVHEDFLQRLARSLLVDTHEAKDVVQEAFLAALRQQPDTAGSLRPGLSPEHAATIVATVVDADGSGVGSARLAEASAAAAFHVPGTRRFAGGSDDDARAGDHQRRLVIKDP